MKTLGFGWMIALMGLTMLSCGNDDDGSDEPLELIGEYENDFGSDESITADAWNGARIADYDNDQNVVYTQLPEDDLFNPGKFTKIVYTEPKNQSFYYCWVEFSLDTLAEAQASDATADDTDPSVTGCGDDSPWTQATRK